MSTQSIRYQERKSNRTWRYAVLALVVATALAIAIVIASAGGAAQTTSTSSTTGGRGQVVPGHQGQDTGTLVVPGGPAGGHPLP